MTIQLSAEQHEIISQTSDDPIRVIDSVSNAEYVLVRSEIFSQMQALVRDDFQTSDSYPAIARAVSPLWDDTKMDDYDRYEEMKK